MFSLLFLFFAVSLSLFVNYRMELRLAGKAPKLHSFLIIFHCFADCLMLVFKDYQDVFSWLSPLTLIIRLITRNGILYRGLAPC